MLMMSQAFETVGYRVRLIGHALWTLYSFGSNVVLKETITISMRMVELNALNGLPHSKILNEATTGSNAPFRAHK